ncbi:MAG: zf-TFIIB domain-containing protein [Candidatus Krumholzibacteriia bacterium]
MNCPACGNGMTVKTIEGIQVDVCAGGCGGIWFDWMELKKVDEPHEAAGEELLDVRRDRTVTVDRRRRRECPHCAGIVLMRHWASVQRRVEVDECPACGGFFLDHGELGEIRRQFAGEDERREAAREVFGDMFDADLQDQHEASLEQLERSRGFARMFRFLLPSYYLPGKQHWGAY